MRKVATALVSAAAGIGVVLGVHGSRSSPPLQSADRAHEGRAPHATRSQGHSSSTSGSQGSLHNGVVIGPSENYGYGVMSIKVTARSGRITALSTAELQIAEPFSQSLAQRAIPILRREVLQAQSANVATVSGATYTSDAYLSSIQAALDRLGS
jgi:uncharacterized protein with FMN-binding domain